MLIPKRRKTARATLLIAAALTSLQAPALFAQSQNDNFRDRIEALQTLNLTAFAGTLPGNPPINQFTLGALEWETNLMLKFVPPVLEAPPHRIDSASGAVFPNVGSCKHRASVPRSGAKYASVYGLEFFPEDDSDWGILGAPTVFHGQSDVEVEFSINGETFHFPDGTFKENGFFLDIPVGANRIVWRADTMISDYTDYPPYFVAALSPLAKGTRLEKVTRGARVIDRFANLLESAGIIDAINGGSIIPDYRHGVTNFGVQIFNVWDDVAPSISSTLSAEDSVVEAEDPGGVLASRHLDRLRAAIEAADTCDREVTLSFDTPRFWPVNETIPVTWTARDPGPNSATGGSNSASVTQMIRVEDTLPPIVIAPMSRVIESDVPLQLTSNPDEPAGTVYPGQVSVFDLADQDPTITNDAPVVFLPITRNVVTWAAEDDRAPVPNRTEKQQLITLKSPGTNTPPLADPQQVGTRSFEAIDIMLTAADNDFLGGLYDPLAFSIETAPTNGFFVAPLYPYFIEDYRVQNEQLAPGENPTDLYCDGFEPHIINNYPDDYLLNPKYVVVTDDGSSYVLQSRPACSGEESALVIKKFDVDGNFLAERQVPIDVDRIEVDAENNIYYFSPPQFGEGGVLGQLDRDLNFVRSFSIQNARYPDGVSMDNPVHALVGKDSLVYMTDAHAVDVLTIDEVGNLNFAGRFYAENIADTSFLNGLTPTPDVKVTLAVDPQQNLYVSDPKANRLLKFEKTKISNTGVVIAGEYVGWMGRCESGSGCDAANERSFGFSCREDSCALPQTDVGLEITAGSRAGQFDLAGRIVFDPQGKLYVADYQNERVQRFTADGFFAGEARSTCDGTCFILGDFGRPLDVSVNSTHFYVLEREKDLLHVFETTPITSMDEETLQPQQQAKVTYQSNNRFVGTDTFGFRVTDGLADDVAEVTIDVARNFRLPSPDGDLLFVGQEDTPLDILLSGSDPDGDPINFVIVDQPENGTIIGVGPDFVYTPDPDFNGTDVFTFRADDEFSSSEPEAAVIQITAVNDRPVLDVVELKPEAGIGYRYPMRIDVGDADIHDSHKLFVDWGDGTREAEGQDSVSDPDDDAPRLSKTPGRPGVIVGQHIYDDFNGPYTLRICLADGEAPLDLTSCAADDPVLALSHVVTPVLAMDVFPVLENDLPTQENEGGAPETAPVMDGTSFEYRLVTDILTAEFGYDSYESKKVVIDFSADPEMTINYVTPQLSACSWSNDSVNGASGSCTMDILQRGANGNETILIGVTLNGTVSADKKVKIVALASGDTRDPTDSSTAHEFKVTVDPDGDADGDGVPNRDDAFPGDPAESVDTDGDGIGNNADRDDDNDDMPDTWENRYGLNATDSSDASLDLDGDGLRNGDEYAASTDPTNGDTDGDTLGDNVDNCALRFNRNQYDQNENGTGDLCDPAQFAGAAYVGNIGGDGQPDVALLQVEAGQPQVYVKNGANDELLTQFPALTAADTMADLVAVPNVVGAGTSGIAVLATDANGAPIGQTNDAANGNTLSNWNFQTESWDVVGVASALDAEQRGQIVILGNHVDPTVADGMVAEVKSAASGDTLAEIRFTDNQQTASDFAILADGDGIATGIAVVTTDEAGAISVQHRSIGGAPVFDTVVFGPDWRDPLITATAAWIAVLARQATGPGQLVVLNAQAGTELQALNLPDDGWRAIALQSRTAVAGAEISVLEIDNQGTIRVEVYEPLTGIRTAEVIYLNADWEAQSLLWSLEGNTSRLAVHARDVTGESVVQQRDAATGALIAEITTSTGSAPPPSPPPPSPPPPPPDNGGGGGGGAFDLFLLMMLTMAIGVRATHRRRRRGN